METNVGSTLTYGRRSGAGGGEWREENTVFVRISVTFSTLHSFISVKKNFDEHVYYTKHAYEP